MVRTRMGEGREGTRSGTLARKGGGCGDGRSWQRVTKWKNMTSAGRVLSVLTMRDAQLRKK